MVASVASTLVGKGLFDGLIILLCFLVLNDG